MRLEKGLRVNADREGEATIRWLENGSRKKNRKKILYLRDIVQILQLFFHKMKEKQL